MKVLILITAFNVENFIEKVILRLPNKLKKSQLDFEILIIDDASNDNTLKEIISIRDKYKDHKITCLSNKVNLGYGGNQKIGSAFLLIFLIPTTLIFHVFPFHQRAVFMNLGLIGGLLISALREQK